MKSNSQKNIFKNKLSKSFETKKYLVNKISSALKLKYKDDFIKRNYQDKDLLKDISDLISTQYYSWKPKELFNPIEQNFLQVMKKKNLSLDLNNNKKQNKSFSSLIDKYKKADNEEKKKLENYIERFRHKELMKKKYKIKKSKINLKNILYLNNNTITNNKQIKLNKIKNNIPYPNLKNKQYISIRNHENEKNYLTTFNNSINITNKDKNIKENNLIKELGTPYHELLDKYNKKKQSELIDILLIEEENKKFEEEQKEIKQKKLEESIELQNYLNMQIMEKNNRKKEEEEINKKYFNYIKEENEKWTKEEEEKTLIEKNKLLEFKKDLLESIEKKNNKLLNSENEKCEIEEIKKLNQIKLNEFEKIKSKNNISQLQNEEEKNLEKNILNKIDEMNNNNGNENEKNILIKKKIQHRILKQEKVKTLLINIYNFKSKFFDNNKYIKEFEEQNKKNDEEIKSKNKIRMKQIEEINNFNLLESKLKREKVMKEKEEEKKYRLELSKSYDNYLKEQKEERKKEIEKYKKYKKELDEQIKENNKRNLQRLNLPYMI